jgi:hypothetical protein
MGTIIVVDMIGLGVPVNQRQHRAHGLRDRSSAGSGTAATIDFVGNVR